ncbi:MAG: beta-glucosidase BglX [bacterium]|nr:beta-glucosidase BglX [bacterium]
MKRMLLTLLLTPLFAAAAFAHDPRIEAKVDDLLARMNLAEKVGQLNQLNGGYATGTQDGRRIDLEESVRSGIIGSFLNIVDLDYQKSLQKIAVEESRLGIPLLYAHDVIHGYRTIFPIPLAEAASWDLEAIERSARIAAIEASASGLHWTFAPMVDIARDPRWGRVMEGAGEDTYLGSRIAEARVHGFQGDDLSRSDTIIACAKHFAGYGAAEGGRDYNTVDVSERVMREVYLPPFHAAVNAGVATLMNAFNVLDRMPASGNKFLVKQVLKGEWNFQGFVVSDWNSFGEMVIHGVAEDNREAAKLAIAAGSDMDMESKAYFDYLGELVSKGEIPEEWVDDAVRRVLRVKYELGMFDDPYKYIDPARKEKVTLSDEHLQAAREVARESIVLLKNEGGLLPLKKNIEKIAVIGQLADSKKFEDMMGSWPAQGKNEEVVTPLEGVKAKVSTQTVVTYEPGCRDHGVCPPELIDRAALAAAEADCVILVVGENGDMSGESKSRAHIGLPGDQLDLVKAVVKAGKPVVMVLMTGRPLVLDWCAEHVPAIVNAWQLGTMGGHAIADVLFGDYNPSGKLPISFPAAVGQIPVYYNHLNTGRPRPPQDVPYVSKYIDCPNEPLYPFGYGLSYTTYEYSAPRLNAETININHTLTVSVDVKNTGSVMGDEVVQLYIRDLVGSVAQPVKELRGFDKIHLNPGESKTVEFTLDSGDLAFWTEDMKFQPEPGEFEVFVGTSSSDCKKARFTLE